MANDTINMLHEDFDYMIEDLREQGQIKDLPYIQGEKDDLGGGTASVCVPIRSPRPGVSSE